MKTLKQFMLRSIFFAVLLFATAACSGGRGEKKAEKVTTEFLDALVKKDFKKAKEYGNESVQKTLASIEKDAEQNKEKGKEVKYEILKRQIADKEGTIRVKISDGEQSREEDIKLARVEGEWKVMSDLHQPPALRFTAYGKDDPMVAAEDKLVLFFEALEHKDFVTAKKYVTPGTQYLLNIVINETNTYKKWNDQTLEIRYEITERVYVNKKCKFKVKIFVGEKVREEYVEVTSVNNVWLVMMPQQHITFLRFVVFYARYESIIVIYREYVSKKHYKHTKKYTKKHTHKHTKKHTRKHTKKRRKKRKKTRT